MFVCFHTKMLFYQFSHALILSTEGAKTSWTPCLSHPAPVNSAVKLGLASTPWPWPQTPLSVSGNHPPSPWNSWGGLLQATGVITRGTMAFYLWKNLARGKLVPNSNHRPNFFKHYPEDKIKIKSYFVKKELMRDIKHLLKFFFWDLDSPQWNKRKRSN